ncbi:hypothetical protein D3C72_1282800 [compost metagenome]
MATAVAVNVVPMARSAVKVRVVRIRVRRTAMARVATAVAVNVVPMARSAVKARAARIRARRTAMARVATAVAVNAVPMDRSAVKARTVRIRVRPMTARAATTVVNAANMLANVVAMPIRAVVIRTRQSRSSIVPASLMQPSASTKSSVFWAKSCNGPIRLMPRCRTGCVTTPTWARAIAPRSPRPSMTCCAICAVIASSAKAAWVPHRAAWPSWA